MSFVLGQNEDVLFKHLSICDKMPGTLYLSNLRISWVPEANKMPPLIFSISEITDDKYSPAKETRSMLRLSVNTSTAPKVFTLTGPDSSLCRKELERLMQLMKLVRSGMNPSETAVGHPSSASVSMEKSQSNKRSRIQTTIDKQSEGLRRTNLLQADSVLRRQYNDLVRDSKLLTDEEFWETRKHLLASVEAKEVTTNKGMLSKLFSDIQETDQNGNKKMTLTPEIILRIFLMYPAVKLAYDAKVPVELTESEFWTKYFQSEYFARDKGLKDADARGSTAARTDDIFSRYEVTESSDVAKGKCSRVSEALQHRDVDLTANYGDFHVVDNSSAACDMPPNAVGSAAAVLAKYMRNSNLVLPQPARPSGELQRAQEESSSCTELLKEKPPAYIPLKLSAAVASHGGSENEAVEGMATDRDTLDSSGTASASSGVVGKAVSASEIKATLHLSFPTRETSVRFLERQKRELSALTASDIGAIGKASHIAADSEQLSEEFKQFMLEKFASVTELLRHFYAMLNREGKQAPMDGSEAATKVDRILEKLGEYLEQLNKEKKRIQQTQQHSKSLPAMFRCLYQLTQLIHRAVDVWDKYRESQAMAHGGEERDRSKVFNNTSVFTLGQQTERNPFAKAY